jgi:hypothetical protein
VRTFSLACLHTHTHTHAHAHAHTARAHTHTHTHTHTHGHSQGGVRGGQAAIRLAAIRQLGVDGDDNASEIRADIGKKRAEKQVEEHVARKAAEERERVEEKKRAEEAAEKAKRAEARARIMAMAGKFGETKDTEA